MPRSRAAPRKAASSSQLSNAISGRQIETRPRRVAVPGVEPPPAVDKRQVAQIFRPLAQDVVEPHRSRKIVQHRRVWRFAVEALLQIVERRDLIGAHH
jgi:hypothetical protein